jgi:hypothetical protein
VKNGSIGILVHPVEYVTYSDHTIVIPAGVSFDVYALRVPIFRSVSFWCRHTPQLYIMSRVPVARRESSRLDGKIALEANTENVTSGRRGQNCQSKGPLDTFYEMNLFGVPVDFEHQ